jgi:putative membrane protein
MNKLEKSDHQQQHQANERTFLAWLRTSIALIGFGFAIARFGLFLRELKTAVTQQPTLGNPWFNSESLGVGLVIFGIVAIALAAWQYNQVYWQIEYGNYRPHRWMIWLMTGIVILLGILSIPLVIWRDTTPSRPTPIPQQQRTQKLPLHLAYTWLRRDRA